jgi:hypothetical protein
MGMRPRHSDYQLVFIAEVTRYRKCNFFVSQQKTLNFFDKNIFNIIIVDANTADSGFGLWLYNVG